MQLSVNSRVACARGSSVIRRSDPVLDPELILSATARIPLVVRLDQIVYLGCQKKRYAYKHVGERYRSANDVPFRISFCEIVNEYRAVCRVLYAGNLFCRIGSIPCP